MPTPPEVGPTEPLRLTLDTAADRPLLTLEQWRDNRTTAYAIFHGRIEAVHSMLGDGLIDKDRAVEMLQDFLTALRIALAAGL